MKSIKYRLKSYQQKTATGGCSGFIFIPERNSGYRPG